MKDISARAWCAIELETPDPKAKIIKAEPEFKPIDIDLLRRSDPSARSATKGVTGQPWPALAKRGWRIIKVKIVPDDDDPVPAPAPEPPRSRPAPAVERPAGAKGKAKQKVLLRCGEE